MNASRDTKSRGLPSTLGILWGVFCVLLLAGCTIGGLDVEQERASGLAGELLDGHTFGQTFIPQDDGLYRR